MDRQDNSSLRPEFEEFDDLHVRPILVPRSLLKRGGIVTLGGIAEWMLGNLALTGLEAEDMSEGIRLASSATSALLMVVVFGLAARFIGNGAQDAPKQTTKERTTQPGHQPRGP